MRRPRKRPEPQENGCLWCECGYQLVVSPYHRAFHVEENNMKAYGYTMLCLDPAHRKTPRERLRWARRLFKEMRKP